VLLDRAQEIRWPLENLFGDTARHIEEVSRRVFVRDKPQDHLFRAWVTTEQLVKPFDFTNCQPVNVSGVAH
jgi:hypothetical protein